jgi:hypothetical protein
MKKKAKEVRRPFFWAKRERDLEGVKRYHAMDVMFYRTNLLVHSRRVPAMTERLLPMVVGNIPGFNSELALLISKYHDDFELITGDIPLQLKLLMNGSQKSALTESDIQAAKMLSSDYGNPVLGEHRYIDLLMHAILKDCPEAQLHSFVDKLEGYAEALHEVFAGNMAFLQPVINYILKTFNDLPGNFPLIASVFRKDNEFFHFPVVQLAPYFGNGKLGAFLHTPKSVTSESGIVHYEMWKEVTLSLPKGMELLTEQKEYHLP